jgi:hypothetical protein
MNKELLQDLNAVYNGLNEDLDESKILLGNIIDKLEQVINYTSCCTLLLCVSETKGLGITKGLTYMVKDTENFYYTITNDCGEKTQYHKSKFEEIKQ